MNQTSNASPPNGHPAWRSGAVHVDIDAYDNAMDIGNVAIKSANLADLRQRSSMTGSAVGKEYVYGTIQPFGRPPQNMFSRFLAEFRNIMSERQAYRVAVLGLFCIICICILLYWCQSTESMGLTAYTMLLVFDLFSLGTCLVTVWVSKQKPSSAYSFGYERLEVLMVFATTMLASFSAIFILKESTERVFAQPEVHTGRLMLGALVGFFCHMVITYGNQNSALKHVSMSSKSSWLQEHFADICKSFCTFVPGLDHLLLPRINPFALVGFAGMVALLVTDFLIDVNNYHIADTVSAFWIALILIGTMMPLSIYSGTILLQTTPAYIIGQLDKCLREASTLDGVLEFRNEHFWTVSFGSLTGSLHVRVRRDADEQMVLAHVTNKLSHLVSPLTIQIIKDDWTRLSSTISFTGGVKDQKMAPPVPLPAQYSHISSVSNSHLPSSYTAQQSLQQQRRLGPLGNSSTPKRASSTPFVTPERDVSFRSDLPAPSPIVSMGTPLPKRTDMKPKGILRAPAPNAGQFNVNLPPTFNKRNNSSTGINASDLSITLPLTPQRSTPKLNVSKNVYR